MTNGPTRVAMVTGCGKRNGIGSQIARALAAAGMTVAVTDVVPAEIPNATVTSIDELRRLAPRLRSLSVPMLLDCHVDPEVRASFYDFNRRTARQHSPVPV